MSKIKGVITPCKKCPITENCKKENIYKTCSQIRAENGLPKAKIIYVREE